MFTVHRFSSCALLLTVAALTGCRSVLNLPPAQEIRGGFTVSAGLSGQPSAARVFTDIGTFAQHRGFVRQSAPMTTQIDPVSQQPVPTAPERYRHDKIKLDVSYDAAHLRVLAFLHSPGGGSDRRVIGQFYQDFHRAYAGSYGGDGAMFENTYTDDAGAVQQGSGGRGGGSDGRRGR